jgi:hypothetical protein
MHIAVEQESSLQDSVEVFTSLLVGDIMGLYQDQEKEPINDHGRGIAKKLSGLHIVRDNPMSHSFFKTYC